jgi:hypothetical protein
LISSSDHHFIGTTTTLAQVSEETLFRPFGRNGSNELCKIMVVVMGNRREGQMLINLVRMSYVNYGGGDGESAV